MISRHCLFPLVFLAFATLVLAQQPGGARQGQPIPTPYLGGTYRALVIGNNDYRDPQGVWPRLKTAVNDAQAVARALREGHGFGDVVLMENATRSETIRAFNNLAERARPDDSVLIYYAGHGYLRESTREGFWIPVDAEGRDDSSFVPNVVIKSKLEVIAARARHVLLVSDSCFSGALLREGARGIRLEDKTPGYFQSVAGKKSVQVLAAGGLEFVDDDYRNSGHSPFTYFFLNELRFHPGAMLEATELSQAVARNVADNVAQTPERGILYGAGHAGGEFLLARTDMTPPPIGPTTPKAAIPIVPTSPVVSAPVAAGGAGWLVYGGFGLGGGLGVFALAKYLEAVDLHGQAEDAASSDPNESNRLQDERDQAAQTALIAAVLGGALLWVTIANMDSNSPQTGQAPGWQAALMVASADGGLGPGVLLQYRW
jgi:hypothetical protein